MRIQYPFYVLGKSFFEINEDGNPYWVTSVRNAKVGVGGFIEDSFIITDATTGEITNLYTAEIDGYTYFYFTLASDDNLYMSSIENSNRQVLLQVGTNVTIKFTPTSESGVCLVQEISF